MKRQRLQYESQGTVVVLGVFLALIGVVAIYYVWGLGQTIVVKQRLQDAADASVLSAATVHARGMNIIALLNVAMATLVSILIMLRVLHTVLDAGVAMALGASLFTFGGSLSAVPALRAGANAARAAYRVADKNAEPLLNVLHTVAVSVRRGVPLVAQAKALSVSQDYSPVVRGAVVFPLYQKLPIADGEFSTTCRHAAGYAAEAIVFPIHALGVPGFIVRFMKGIVRKTVVSFGNYFCGAGGRPPSATYEVEVREPRLELPAYNACASGDEIACAELERRLTDIRNGYDFQQGRCDVSGQAKIDCEEVRVAARTQCQGSANNWSLRVVNVKKEYVLKKTRQGTYDVDVASRREINPRLLDWKKEADYSVFGPRPCLAGFQQQAWRPWNKNENEPLCSTEPLEQPTAFELSRRAGNRLVRHYLEITDVLDCTRTEERTVKARGRPLEPVLRKPPQEMCSCAQQGQELFQLRAIALGKSMSDEAVFHELRDVVEATGRTPLSSDSFLRSMAAEFGRFAVAQAEYYFAGPEERSEWLWHMNWRARMRRVRSSQDKHWTCREKIRYACPPMTGPSSQRSPGRTFCDSECTAWLEQVSALLAH